MSISTPLGSTDLVLADILSPDVVTVDPEDTLRTFLETLSASGVSGARVVTSGGHVVGVVSATDILEFETSTPGVPTLRTDQVEWGEQDDDLEPRDGAELRSLYFLDLWADAGADVLERFSQVEGPEWDLLNEHTVSEIMTRRVHALPPDTDVRSAARAMLGARVHRILVMQGARLRGIVTTTDIVRAVADGRI